MGWTDPLKRSAYMRRRFEAGLCRECSEPHEPGKLRCAAHLKNTNRESRKRYQRNAEVIRVAAREKRREAYRANPEKIRSYQRDLYRKYPDRYRGYELKQHYGLSMAEFEALRQKQGGVCAICGKPPMIGKRGKAHTPKRSPHLCVDHDHKTGKVRGLLCHWCNSHIVAGIEKSGASLKQIAAYLGVSI